MTMVVNEEDEFELSLELSVGGTYAKRRKTITIKEDSATKENGGKEGEDIGKLQFAAIGYEPVSLRSQDNAVDFSYKPSESANSKTKEPVNLQKGDPFDHGLEKVVPNPKRESSCIRRSATKPALYHHQVAKRIIKKPPKPPSSNKAVSVAATYIPCVSATGNGPNGKTITGFLYKYTVNEVCIMCECHRYSFSPAEFVKHAGGADVSNPLRHITVVHPEP